jgi:thiol-disulfide isomerase/thioredoxin
MEQVMFSTLKENWRRLRSRFWASLAFDVAVLIAVFAAVHAWQTRDLPDDEAAPVTKLAVLDEGGSRSAVIPGQPGIVYFFAPWCGVCRASIDNLDDLVAGGQVAWGTVVALDYADAAEVRDFIERTGVSLPVLMGDSRTALDWSVRAFPTYYVIDADGRIDSRSVGYSTWLGMRVRSWLAQ